VNILILSDLHLTSKFEKNKYNYLIGLISKYDKVILNGDFWSAYSTTATKFMKSKWNKLFPLLKSKDTTYIYGNHDRKEWNTSDLVNLFSTKQTNKEIINIGTTTYIIEHGNNLLPKDSLTNTTFMKINRALKIDDLIRYPIEKWIIKRLGINFYTKFTKGLNEILKHYASSNLKNNEILITGHTHSPEIDLNNHFIAGGIVNFGHAQYLVIKEEDIELIKETY